MQNLFSGVLLVLCTVDYAVSQTNSNFVTEPSNLTTFIGAPAVFSCSYPVEPNLQLLWLLDGLLIKDNNNSCISGTEISEQRHSMAVNTSLVQISILRIRNVIRECDNLVLECLPYKILSGHTVFFNTSQEAVLTLHEFPQVEGVELYGRNGTILISWDEPSVDPEFKNQRITYKLNIIPSDSFGDSVSISHNGNGRCSRLIFSPYNPSACTTFNISITAFLNSFAGVPSYVTGSSYDGSPPDTTDSALVTSVTSNGTDLIYEIILSNGVPICYMNLTATNVLSGKVYNITMEVDTQVNTTLTTFKVDNEKLPFDENYNATVDVYNPPSNISSRLVCFNLSTHDIQTANLNDGLLRLGFVKNTSARGAFLVIGDTKSHCYDYVPVKHLKMNNLTDLEVNISDPDNRISTCSSGCTLLVYVLKDDGLPKHNLNNSMTENVTARPVVKYSHITRQNRTPGTDINSGQMNETVDAVVNVTTSSITFHCIIRNDSDNFQGCVTIIHSTLNYSALIVNTVDKNSTFSFDRMSASPGEEYLYAVFPWSQHSGLLGSKVITKGATHNHIDETPSPRWPPGPAVIAIIVIIVVFVVITVTANIGAIMAYIINKKPDWNCRRNQKL